MENNSSISTKEHRAFLAAILLAFLFILVSTFSICTEGYNNDVVLKQEHFKNIAEGKSSDYDQFIFRHPVRFGTDMLLTKFVGFVFLPLALFCSWHKEKRYAATFVMLCLPFLSFCLWYSGTQRRNIESEIQLEGFNNQFLDFSNIFDFLCVGVLVVLLIWNSSILFRIFYHSRLNKPALP